MKARLEVAWCLLLLTGDLLSGAVRLVLFAFTRRGHVRRLRAALEESAR